MTENEKITEAAPFSFSKKEMLAAAVMYPAAYVYTLLASDDTRLWFGIFVLLFVLTVEYLCRGVPLPRESLIWLGCIALITVCVAFDIGQVWSAGVSIFFVHALALWWTLCRSGKLLEGRSGHLLPGDAFNALIRFPFGGFSLRIRCMRQGASALRGEKKSGSRLAAAAAVIALFAGAVLLYLAASNLAAADAGFGGVMEKVLAFFTLSDAAPLREFLVRFAVSLPVGAWLFGLIDGCRRCERVALDRQSDTLRGALARLRVVPNTVWLICAAAFAAVYLLFFVIQGSYLFGAFSRSLPAGFTVAEYARQGFFELCRVMGINLVLLWLMTRTASRSAAESRALKIASTVLLAAGMLFAVIAVSKLWLYISCFGFTPRRLQSTWLACTLFAGSAAAAYSLWTQKKSFRAWLVFTAVTLSLLHLF